CVLFDGRGLLRSHFLAAYRWLLFPFFFHAEDGIRYFHVTGVQTCALPICQILFIITAKQTSLIKVHYYGLNWIGGNSPVIMFRSKKIYLCPGSRYPMMLQSFEIRSLGIFSCTNKWHEL